MLKYGSLERRKKAEVQFVLPQAMTEVTVAIAAKIMQEAKKNARELKRKMKEAEEADGDNLLAMKKKLKKGIEEKKLTKALRDKEALQERLARSSIDIFSDLDGYPAKRTKTKLTRLDHWQLGNKAARVRKSGYIAAATCASLEEVRLMLQTQSWAVMNNMTSLFPEGCRPCKEQADYILNTNEDNKVVIFEGAVYSDTSSVIHLETKKDKQGGRCRYQLKQAGHSGQWARKYVDYQKQFRPQLECILKGMFGDSPAGDVDNWNANLNSIVGGVCHQHPHCDHGRVGTYQDLEIFPFGALHGYGLTPFSLWILPPGLEYGFMHTFASDQIVFLRGDCVHAGVPSPVPRCHYEFFPLLSAGWSRRNPFWTRPATTDTTFAWQTPSHPFAYPDVGTPSDLGTMSVSYPVSVTDALMLPLKGEIHPVPKKQRGATKKRMSAQLVNY